MRILLLACLFTGCTERSLAWNTDQANWEEAALRLSTSNPEDAWPWLDDIPATSPLYDDARLLRIRGLDPEAMRQTAAELATRPGPHRDDAVALFAETFEEQPYRELLAAAVEWGLADDGVALVRRHYQNQVNNDGMVDVKEPLALALWQHEPRAHAAFIAQILDAPRQYQPPDSERRALLRALEPHLDPNTPELNATYAREWPQIHGFDRYQAYLEQTPSFVDRRWALLLRGNATLRTDPEQALRDLDTVLQGPEHDDLSAQAEFLIGLHHARQGTWGPDEPWTDHHATASELFERAFLHASLSHRVLEFGGRSMVLQHQHQPGDTARIWLGRMALYDTAAAAELAEDVGLDPIPFVPKPWEWPRYRCCNRLREPATTLVRVFPGPDGPTAVAAIPVGGSPCAAHVILGRYRDAIHACVLQELPDEPVWDGRIEIDDAGTATPLAPIASPLEACLAEVAEVADAPDMTWAVRVLQPEGSAQ